MIQFAEAIYLEGVLKPVTPLTLVDNQRVKLIVEPVASLSPEERQLAWQRIFEDIDRSQLRVEGPLPSREELHDRRP